MIILNKKEEVAKVDLQNVRKQGATVEKLIFSFADFLVKLISSRSLKANCFFLTSISFLQGNLYLSQS